MTHFGWLTRSLKPSLALSALLFAGVVSAQLPSTGQTKSQVLKSMGEPIQKAAPVGKPPITRWVYENATVVFEYNRVIHAFKRIPKLETRPASQLPRRAPQAGPTNIITYPTVQSVESAVQDMAAESIENTQQAAEITTDEITTEAADIEKMMESAESDVQAEANKALAATENTVTEFENAASQTAESTQEAMDEVTQTSEQEIADTEAAAESDIDDIEADAAQAAEEFQSDTQAINKELGF